MQTETHPHKAFVPRPLKAIIVGSFPGRSSTIALAPEQQWFYSAKRNQLWSILEIVFGMPLPDKATKKAILRQHHIGLVDILLTIRRKKPSNADQDLEIVAYNDTALAAILDQHPKVLVCFTSRFVEKQFKTLFPDHADSVLLPSPSPRYARLSINEKAAVYKQILLDSKTPSQ